MKAILLATVGFLVAVNAQAQQTLYNGIVLPEQWPPNYEQIPRADLQQPLYLVDRPEVVPIDVGRQLFVDDFLIQSTTLQRTFHYPEPCPKNPILKAEHPSLEIGGINIPNAAPYSDGVWWDPKDRQFKMWYLARNSAFTCYATSKDGVTWTRPVLPASKRQANDVVDFRGDSSTTWLDLETNDRAERFKMLTWRATKLHYRTSSDGVNWTDPIWTHGQGVGDRTTFFYNPFRRVWVYSVRKSNRDAGRVRYYLESPDPAEPPDFAKLCKWTRADELDRVQDVINEGTYPDLYNVDATPYESLMLGLFSIHSVEHNEYPGDKSHPKIVHVSLGYSRDGFHWSRPDRQPFLDIAGQPTAWNRGNVQSVGGGCLVVGDKLYFYYSGRNSHKKVDDGSGMATGVAFLRRDGFASLDAGNSTGSLTTRPVVFTGQELFVNVDAPNGELLVEVLSVDGTPIQPFTQARCKRAAIDSTIHRITWDEGKLAQLAGTPVRLRFHLRNGSLYSFWVSRDQSGASNGYVAAGGPGFNSNRDTVGTGAYTDQLSKVR